LVYLVWLIDGIAYPSCTLSPTFRELLTPHHPWSYSSFSP
jgi:hypothetical protein